MACVFVNPQRIQRKRTKGFRMQEVSQALNGLPCVYVGRGTKWGNPFTVAEYGHNEAVEAYREYVLDTDPDNLRYGAIDVSELKGKNLACWCPLDCACHADVLLDMANQ